MEFRFNVNRLLPRTINKIGHNLLPDDFRGDRRELHECQRLLSRILDEMGEASANAQGLSKPITSAQKLRDTDHIVYLLVDHQGDGGLGSVIGLLKTGSKNLFMFDENGLHYQLQPRCVLDFYVHESRQRMGLGNELYQHMLAEEKMRPVKLAIDRPSEKFLQFLRKHYGLERIIPQNNKFVVFRGFFDDEFQDTRAGKHTLPLRNMADNDSHSSNNNNVGNNHNNNYSSNNNNSSTNNENHQNTGSKSCKSASVCGSGTSNGSANGGRGNDGVTRSAYGRYAAARPPCSMATIIHSAATLGHAAEHTGAISASMHKPERPRSLSIFSDDERKHNANESSIVPTTPAVRDERFAEITVSEDETARIIEEPSRSASAISNSSNVELKSRNIVIKDTSRNIETDAVAHDLDDIPKSPERPRKAANAKIHSTSAAGKSSTNAFTPSRRETSSAAAGIPSAGMKTSPSCAQEVSGNQSAHLDLKFYHSPLW